MNSQRVMSLEDALVEVWRQALVEEKPEVQLNGEFSGAPNSEKESMPDRFPRGRGGGARDRAEPGNEIALGAVGSQRSEGHAISGGGTLLRERRRRKDHTVRQ